MVIVGVENFKIFWLIFIGVLIFGLIFFFYIVVFVCEDNRLFVIELEFIEGFVIKVLFLCLIFKFDFLSLNIECIGLSLMLL